MWYNGVYSLMVNSDDCSDKKESRAILRIALNLSWKSVRECVASTSTTIDSNS